MRHQAPTVLTAAVVLTFAATSGCSKKSQPESFVKASIEAVEGKPQALWTALPKSYQADVQKLLTDFSGKMNAELYNDGFVVAGKFVKVLETKQAFILTRPELQGMVSPEDLKQGWDPLVRVLARIVDSPLKTHEGLKGLDVGAFLEGPIGESIQDLTAVAEIAAKSAPMPGKKDVRQTLAKLKAAKISVENATDTTATVKVEIEGEEPETIEMVKVEEKWIPKELQEAWKPMIASANGAIAQMKFDTETVTQVKMVKAMVEPTLDALLASKTQAEFDGHVEKALAGSGFGPKDQLATTADAEKPAMVDDRPKRKKRKKTRRKRRRKRRR